MTPEAKDYLEKARDDLDDEAKDAIDAAARFIERVAALLA